MSDYAHLHEAHEALKAAHEKLKADYDALKTEFAYQTGRAFRHPAPVEPIVPAAPGKGIAFQIRTGGSGGIDVVSDA